MPYKDPEKRKAYHAAHSAAHYLKNREKIAARQAVYYIENREAILERTGTYKANHAEKIKGDKAAYYIENKSRIDATHAAYNIMHREEIKARNAANHAANPEKYKARNTAWAQKNPEKMHAYKHRRRAREADVHINDLSAAQILEIKKACGLRCTYCGKKFPVKKLTVDHITPISKGGDNSLHNVTVACVPCNSRKHTGPPLKPVQPLLLTVAFAKKPKKREKE